MLRIQPSRSAPSISRAFAVAAVSTLLITTGLSAPAFAGSTSYSSDTAESKPAAKPAAKPAVSSAVTPAVTLASDENKVAMENDGGTGTGVYDDERIIGDVNAPVTIVEYASMTCPHCATFHNGPYKELKKEYIDTGKVRLLVRDLPWDGMAFRAALVSRCLPESQYERFVAFVFKDIATWSRTEDDFFKAVSLVGMSRDKAEACINDEARQQTILERRQIALDDLKVSGTPYLFINGARLNGSREYSELKDAVETALKNLGS